MTLQRPRILIQPGWQNSGPEHWQSHWQAVLGGRRVESGNWDDPDLALWVQALDAALDAEPAPAIVIAHSLGCITLAHAAARRPGRIAGAFLVAPADVERDGAPACLQRFAPIPRTRLPFPVRVIASTDDPFCRPDKALALARDWGATLDWLHGAGHINTASGHRRWEEGLPLLQALIREVARQADDILL